MNTQKTTPRTLKFMGLVFAIAGIASLIKALLEFQHGQREEIILMFCIGILFTSLGTGFMVGGKIAKNKFEERARLEAEHPNAPWNWKKEWFNGRIYGDSKQKMLIIWAFALGWNGFTVPLAFIMVPRYLAQGNKLILLILIFPLIGIFILWSAITALLRWKRYGRSYFEMAAVPGVVGGDLGGMVNTSVNIRPDDGFQLQLKCVHRYITGSSNNRRTEEKTLWEQSQVMSHEVLEDDSSRSAIPVLFSIPYDCKPTDESDTNDKIIWRLKIEAKLPGVDYMTQFEVPVFRTEASRKDDDRAGEIPDPLSDFREKEDPQKRLEEVGVKVLKNFSGGTVFNFRSGRNIGASAGITFIFFICVTALWATIVYNAHWFAILIAGFFTLILGLAFLSSWFTTGKVTVYADHVELISKFCGLGSTVNILTAELDSIELTAGMTSGEKVFYDLIFHRKDGYKKVVSAHIDGLVAAEALRKAIEGELTKSS